MSHIVFRLVYESSEESVVKIQYLASEDSLFVEMSSWRWRDHKHLSHPFLSEHEAKKVVLELGDKHAIIIPRDNIKVEKKHHTIPSDEVYRETCKRLGERED